MPSALCFSIATPTPPFSNQRTSVRQTSFAPPTSLPCPHNLSFPTRQCRVRFSVTASLDDPFSTLPNQSTAPEAFPSVATHVEHSQPSSSFKWLDRWFPITWEFNMPEAPLHKFTVFDRPYILVRDDANGKYVAMDDLCPHRAVPLSQGRVFNRVLDDGCKQTVLECRYHGWRFGCDGACLNIPIKADAPTKAANIRGVYQCDVLELGSKKLIFAWLGDQARVTPLQLTVPPELRDKETPVMLFRTVNRFFPYPYEIAMENFLDASHVPFTHHGVEGHREKVKEGHYVTDVLESDMQTGRFKSSVRSPYRTPTIHNDPLHARYSTLTDEKTGRSRLHLLAWFVPVSRDRSYMFFTRAFVNPPFTFKLMYDLQPAWYDHALGQNVLDGDLFLQGQHVDLVKQRLQTGKPAWRSRYLLSEAQSDDLVAAWRAWLDSVSDLMPFTSPPLSHPPMPLQPEQINDRLRLHTMHCSVCTAALRNARLVSITSKIIAPLAFFGAIVAAVAVSVLQPGIVASGSLAAYAWACFALAVVACVAFYLAGRVIRELTYTDTAYKKAMTGDTQF